MDDTSADAEGPRDAQCHTSTSSQVYKLSATSGPLIVGEIFVLVCGSFNCTTH